MTYQVRIDFYAPYGRYSTPIRESNVFHNKKEAWKFYKNKRKDFKENGKQGYGKVIMTLRLVEQVDKNYCKELKRLEMDIL